jgi:hypothetical protein
MTQLTDEEKKIRARVAAKKYRDANRDKIKREQKEYRESHKNERKEYQEKWYQENKEENSEKRKEYYKNNEEDIKQKSIDYYYDNKEESIKKYKDEHKKEKSKYNKQYSIINQEKLKEYHRAQNKTLKGRFRTAKGAAKKRNREFNLTFEQFSQEVIKPCFYCNDHFRKNEIGTGCGLDRLNNKIGYVVENIVSCCSHCNYLKSDVYSQIQTIAMVNVLIELENKTITNL